MLAVLPGGWWPLKSALVMVAVVACFDRVAFLRPACCCHGVGQVNRSVQPLRSLDPLLVRSTLATKPLPQSLASVKRTPQELVAGAVVVIVTGGEDQDTRPARSRATTFTV